MSFASRASRTPSRLRLLAPVLAALSLACQAWRERPPAVPDEPVVAFPGGEQRSVAGVPLLHIPAEVGTAAVGVSLRLGSTSDPADQPGLTVALLRLLRGHGERAGGLAATLGELGGEPELSLARDGAVLSVEVASEHAPAALRALLAAVRSPTADAAEHATLGAEAAAARARARDDPGALALAALHHVVYPAGHPYRRTDLSAGTWSIEHVLEAHRRDVGPATLAIVVAGEADRAAIDAAATAALAGWTSPARAPAAPAAIGPPPRALHLIARPGLGQAVIALGAPLPITDDRAARIAAILVQNALHARLREDMAVTYSVDVGLGLTRGPGLAHVRTEVDAAATTATLVATRKVLASLARGPVDPDVVARVCRLERLGLMLERQTNAALLLAAARLHWLARPVDDDERRAAAGCDDLAPAVQTALRAGFDPGHLQVVVVADPARVEAALRGQDLGPLTRLDPAEL